MRSATLAMALASAASVQAAETVLGVYILSRHGDRTDKAHAPTKLTELGVSQVIQSGEYFRNRYVVNASDSYINGIATNVVDQSQVYVSAPVDTVLMGSALGFLQGLYPPAGQAATASPLRNGTTIQSPNNGMQFIPVYTSDTGGTNAENAAWLQGASGCVNAVASSKGYLQTSAFKSLLNSTLPFYQSLVPVINGTFSAGQANFSNAYSIFDVINVASIHNTTINSASLLTNETLLQVRTLAETHEFNSAFNASEPVRAIAGSSFAAEVISHLNETITTAGKMKFGIQFAAYGTFQSFFGLAQLPAANSDFYGIPDYASTATFELFTNVSSTPFPSVDDLYVRFSWHNGSTSNGGNLTAYPLFGQTSLELSWNAFVSEMNKFAVNTQQEWCNVCGPTSVGCSTGTTTTSSSGSGASTVSSGSGGISKVVAGVIGAVVTLAVVAILTALAMLAFGLRLVKKGPKKGQ